MSQFPEFHEFRSARSDPAHASPASPASPTEPDPATPEEGLAVASRELRAALAAELMDRVLGHPSAFFEQLVLDVLHGMGYGGTRLDAVERVGQSGDGGVDRVIVGLEEIYVQATRWALDRVVGRPEIQRFVGALHGQRASNGVFITTSSFSAEAMSYAEGVIPRVVLIDGRELAQLVIDHDVGVAIVERVDVKRVDSDYFDSDESTPATAEM